MKGVAAPCMSGVTAAGGGAVVVGGRRRGESNREKGTSRVSAALRVTPVGEGGCRRRTMAAGQMEDLKSNSEMGEPHREAMAAGKGETAADAA